MRSLPDTVSAQKVAYNTAASGGSSVITLAAIADERHVIDWIMWSYAGTPTSGSLTITGVEDASGAAISPVLDITAGGPGELVFGDRGLKCVKNTAVVITLADGLQTKRLWVQYR